MKKTNLSKGRKGQKGRQAEHDISLRRKIAKEYLEGDLSTTQLGQRYNVHHQYVSRWAKQFSSELAEDLITTPMTEQKQEQQQQQEQQDVAALQKQLEVLKKKLDFEQMKNFALETMVDLAKSELGIDLRKNSGAKQPKV